MAGEAKYQNSYQPLIECVCELYAAGDFVRAEDKSTIWLMTEEELEKYPRGTRVSYLKEKLKDKKKLKPLWQAAEAFNAHAQFVNLGLLSGLTAEDVVKKFEPLKKYLSSNCLLKLSPDLRKKLFTEENIQPSQRFDNPSAEKIYRNLQVVESVLQDKSFNPEYQKVLNFRRSQLAFELYTELHREYGKLEMPDAKKIEYIETMIEMVNKINWSRTTQFKFKSQLYGVLSVLHRRNGNTDKARLAKDEELRFGRSAENILFQAQKKRKVSEWER